MAEEARANTERGLREVLADFDVIEKIEDLERGISFMMASMDVHFRDQLEEFLDKLKDWVRELKELDAA